jgi:pimeloyl-ACP methyl ester carboxylesterase
MNVNISRTPQPSRRERVIALHCSGAAASQWSYLAEALGGRFELLAPEHFGCDSTGPWTGEHPFTLADEAARAIKLIDGSGQRVHLVGHSYGGGVALKVALSRPNRIASMALYEPSAFHLLRQLGEPGANAFAEIASIARATSESLISGHYRAGIAAFVDYWNGPGAWDALRPAAQNALTRWAPKAPLDFHALIEEPTPPSAYSLLTFPVLVMRGEHAPTPTRVIVECLSNLLPTSRLVVVDGAGHMGPLTHAPEVCALIVRHIVDTEANARPSLRASPAAMLGEAGGRAEAVS